MSKTKKRFVPKKDKPKKKVEKYEKEFNRKRERNV